MCGFPPVVIGQQGSLYYRESLKVMLSVTKQIHMVGGSFSLQTLTDVNVLFCVTGEATHTLVFDTLISVNAVQ